MKMYDIEIVNGSGEIVLSQSSDDSWPQAIVITAEQADEVARAIREIANEIKPRYPWWVVAGYGTREMAIAAGLKESKEAN